MSPLVVFFITFGCIFGGLVLGMASLFMMLELDNPFSGLITVSDAALRNALMYLGQ